MEDKKAKIKLISVKYNVKVPYLDEQGKEANIDGEVKIFPSKKILIKNLYQANGRESTVAQISAVAELCRVATVLAESTEVINMESLNERRGAGGGGGGEEQPK